MSSVFRSPVISSLLKKNKKNTVNFRRVYSSKSVDESPRRFPKFGAEELSKIAGLLSMGGGIYGIIVYPRNRVLDELVKQRKDGNSAVSKYLSALSDTVLQKHMYAHVNTFLSKHDGDIHDRLRKALKQSEFSTAGGDDTSGGGAIQRFRVGLGLCAFGWSVFLRRAEVLDEILKQLEDDNSALSKYLSYHKNSIVSKQIPYNCISDLVEKLVKNSESSNAGVWGDTFPAVEDKGYSRGSEIISEDPITSI